jgi:hypothetical protein
MELQSTALPDATKGHRTRQLIATGAFQWPALVFGRGRTAANVTLTRRLVSGTPTAGGLFTTVQANDGSGNSVQRNVTLAVNTP